MCTVRAISRGGAVWSARLAHNQEVVSSNLAPATKKLFKDAFYIKGVFFVEVFRSAKVGEVWIFGLVFKFLCNFTGVKVLIYIM